MGWEIESFIQTPCEILSHVVVVLCGCNDLSLGWKQQQRVAANKHSKVSIADHC